MWNLEPSGKVANIVVKSHNGILQVKEWYTEGWLDGTTLYQSLVKSWWASCCHCKVALVDLFGRVNVIGLWNWYGTPLYAPLM